MNDADNPVMRQAFYNWKYAIDSHVASTYKKKYEGLLLEGVRAYGRIVEVPNDFVKWIGQQPRLTELETIRDWDRQLR